MAYEKTYGDLLRNGRHKTDDDTYNGTTYLDLPYPVHSFSSHAISTNPAVLSALGKVQRKIRELEEIKNNAKKQMKQEEERSRQRKKVRQPDVNEELAIAISRCRLMEEQLQHLRHSLQDKANGNSATNGFPVDHPLTYAEKEKNYVPVQNTWSDELIAGDRYDIGLSGSTHSQASSPPLSRPRKSDETVTKMPRKSDENVTRMCRPSIDVNLCPRFQEHEQRAAAVKKQMSAPSHVTGGATRTACALQKKLASSHYHMHLRDLPFLLGGSTAPSFSLPANIQKVIAMLKTHSTHLCSGMSKTESRKEPHRIISTSGDTQANGVHDTMEQFGIADLLVLLQGEHEQMVMLRSSMVHEWEEEDSDDIRKILADDIGDLDQKLEAKAHQIEMVRKLKGEIKLKVNGINPHVTKSEVSSKNPPTTNYHRNLLKQTKKIQSILTLEK